MHMVVFWAVFEDKKQVKNLFIDVINSKGKQRFVVTLPKRHLCVATLVISSEAAFSYVQRAVSAVLKRATTIKRRGVDVGHRGQPGEEQYGDISSVGEWESGQAHKYVHIKCKAYSSGAHCALQECAFRNAYLILL